MPARKRRSLFHLALNQMHNKELPLTGKACNTYGACRGECGLGTWRWEAEACLLLCMNMSLWSECVLPQSGEQQGEKRPKTEQHSGWETTCRHRFDVFALSCLSLMWKWKWIKCCHQELHERMLSCVLGKFKKYFSALKRSWLQQAVMFQCPRLLTMLVFVFNIL